MDDLQFYILFKSSTLISGRWEGENERLCAVERNEAPFTVGRLFASSRSFSVTARSAVLGKKHIYCS